MVDVLASYEKLADWRNHDPRQHTTNYLLDGEPYGGPTHPMRTSGSRGLVHYTGIHHTSESRRLTFSPRAVIVPEDYAELDRQERVPRSALDGMFERQPMEQYVYDTTGQEVAVRTVMRERQSPFNGERDTPRVESNLITLPLFKTRQQRVRERVGAGVDVGVGTSDDNDLTPTPQLEEGDPPDEGPYYQSPAPAQQANPMEVLAAVVASMLAGPQQQQQPSTSNPQLDSPPYRPFGEGSSSIAPLPINFESGANLGPFTPLPGRQLAGAQRTAKSAKSTAVIPSGSKIAVAALPMVVDPTTPRDPKQQRITDMLQKSSGKRAVLKETARMHSMV
jgi:hypothetical protein